MYLAKQNTLTSEYNVVPFVQELNNETNWKLLTLSLRS